MFILKDEIIEITSTKKVRKRLLVYPIKFKIARVLKGYSRTELSNISGVTRKTILSIERGDNHVISKQTFAKLISALGQPEEFFMTDFAG